MATMAMMMVACITSSVLTRKANFMPKNASKRENDKGPKEEWQKNIHAWEEGTRDNNDDLKRGWMEESPWFWVKGEQPTVKDGA
jgi:hypothetical protein